MVWNPSRLNNLRRVFILSFLAGLALVVAVVAIFPLPVHERVPSRIDVLTNGGRQENFQIRWPQDLIALPELPNGLQAVASGGTAVLGDAANPAAAELYRLRDANGTVIGIASRTTSRMVSSRRADASVSNWVLMIPSRGALMLVQENSADIGPRANGDGWVMPAQTERFWSVGSRYRITSGPAAGGSGRIERGTGEFVRLSGSYSETWELDELASGSGTRGHILISTVTVAAQ